MLTVLGIIVIISTMRISNPSNDQLQDPGYATVEWEKKLGKAIRALRIAMNARQQDLAKSANISLTALRNLEAGRGSTLHSFILVLRALGETEWLQSLAPNEHVASPMELLREREGQRPPTERVRVTRADK